MELICHKVALPLIVPFSTSFGTQTERDAMIFELKKDGITAYSEAVTDYGPHYSYEDNETAFHIIRKYLVAAIFNVPKPEEFLKSVKHVKGHNMAKAAMEMLLWDFWAKDAGQPLHKYLGPSKGKAEVGISIGIDDTDVMKERAQEAVNRGFKRVKVKIKKGMEEAIVNIVREGIGNKFPLSVDANTDYTLDDIEVLRSLDKYSLAYMEQPLGHDDIIDHAELAKLIRTPICLDESIISEYRASKAIKMEACKYINIKPGRVSGLAESMKIAQLAREYNIHTWVGGMLETGVGRAFNVALASSKFIDSAGDTSPNDRYFSRDIVKNPFKMMDGVIDANDGPGIGIQIDAQYLKKVEKERIKLL